MELKRCSVRRLIASVVGVGIGIALLGPWIIMGHTDLATDGSQLAVSVLRASFNAGRRLDVADGGWQYIVGPAVVAIIALADDIGVTHHSKVFHDHTDADALSSDDLSVIADAPTPLREADHVR